MNDKGLFITGTNTGVGKTVVTGLLAKHYQDQGLNVVPQKWMQSGCATDSDVDVYLDLMGKTREDFAPYIKAMSPVRLEHPSSPHLAAALENTTVQPSVIKNAYEALTHHFDKVIVEGVGGFLCPYTYTDTLADLVVDLDLPVIIVVDNVLGAINHTLLTIEAVNARGLRLEGFIVNHSQPDGDAHILADNPKVIQSCSGVPLLATLAYNECTLHWES